MSNPYRDWETTTPDNQEGDPQAGSSASHRPPSASRSGWGCFVYGCLGVIAVGVLTVILLGVGAYLFARNQIKQYTSDTPMDVPVVEVDPERVEEINARIERFAAVVDDSAPSEEGDAADPGAEQAAGAPSGDAPEGPDPPRELVITADEINLLIASQPELRGRVYVTISDGQILGKVSLPTDDLPLASGRFFNAEAAFNVALQDGQLVVTVADASVKGQPLPQFIMDALASENLADDLYKDPKVRAQLAKFETIEVGQNEIVLVLTQDAAAGSETPADMPQEDPQSEESAEQLQETP